MSDLVSKIKEQLSLGSKVLRLVYESSPKLSILYFVSTFGSSILPAINLYLGKLIVDAIVLTITNRSNTNINSILIFTGLLFLTNTLNNLLWVFRRHSFNLLKDVFIKYAVEKIASHTSSLDVAFFENPEFHDKLEKVQREVYSRPFDSMGAATSTIGSTISLLSLVAILIRLAWWAPILLLIISIPRLFFRLHFSYYTYSITDRRSPYNRKINQLINILIGKDFIHEVKIFSLKDYLLNKFHLIYSGFLKENETLSKKGVVQGFVVDMLSTIFLTLLNLYAIFKAIMRISTIGDLTLFFNTLSRFQTIFSDLSDYISRFYENSLFLKHYFEFLEIKPQIVNSPNAQKITGHHSLQIVFNNVSFGYTPEKLILKNINLSISDGKNIALIGENGVGKTTLIKLLLRLYDVTSGEILINGKNIKEIDLESLRSEIGVIFQNFKTYEMTVTENIGFGDIKNIGNIKKIKEAAELANASTFIEKFPNQYETVLGKHFEKGEELSGGQWQKIALARAFFKDSKVLIMDEPTSALDPKSEYEVFKNLIAHTKNKSLILISHRFSTVRLADEIIVLDDGKIAEQGSHESLIKLNGKYAKLYNLQAKWYK